MPSQALSANARRYFMADSLQRWNEDDPDGRWHGGQSLGQASMAASLSAPPNRVAMAMQFMFLQGSVPDQPIDVAATLPLRVGKQFSFPYVHSTQDCRHARLAVRHLTDK